MNDKYDESEYKSIFDKNTGVIVKRMLLGCGKTTCLKIYAKKQKILFVSPYNRLYLEFLNDGYDVCTLHQLLGLRVNNMYNDIETGHKYDISKYDAIVFDKIYCHGVKKLFKIKQFMCDNYKIRYFATRV
jgi:hypothetical protein